MRLMPDDTNDSHLAPAPPEEPVPPAPPGLRSLRRFSANIGRFVRLAERQGTRLVDLFERYVVAVEQGNAQASRLAEAAERMAGHADGYLGVDAGAWCELCESDEHDTAECTEGWDVRP
jgi:hypothetical protein